MIHKVLNHICTWVPQRHQSLGFLPHLVCPLIWLLERQGEELHSKRRIIRVKIKIHLLKIHSGNTHTQMYKLQTNQV